MISTADPNLICQNGQANCFCKIGFYSPSGDPAKNKDCTARNSVARLGVELTLDPTNFKWEDGVALKRNYLGWEDMTLTDPISGKTDKEYVEQYYRDYLFYGLSPVRGSSSITSTGGATLVQSNVDETQLMITGLIFTYTWFERPIGDSPNSLGQDLISQLKIDLLTPEEGRYFDKLDDDHLVITDLTTYPTWGEWGQFDPCDKASCTQTKKKKCVDTKNPQSQIPCIEDPDHPSTETLSCTCRKYAG